MRRSNSLNSHERTVLTCHVSHRKQMCLELVLKLFQCCGRPYNITSSIFRPFKTPLPLVIKRHQAATPPPPMMTSSRNVKFDITNHLKPLYNRLLVLMHSAETAFRNRHDALNVFPGSARPLLDATYEWHTSSRAGGSCSS